MSRYLRTIVTALCIKSTFVMEGTISRGITIRIEADAWPALYGFNGFVRNHCGRLDGR